MVELGHTWIETHARPLQKKCLILSAFTILGRLRRHAVNFTLLSWYCIGKGSLEPGDNNNDRITSIWYARSVASRKLGLEQALGIDTVKISQIIRFSEVRSRTNRDSCTWWKANSFVKDLNSERRNRFQRRYPLNHENHHERPTKQVMLVVMVP